MRVFTSFLFVVLVANLEFAGFPKQKKYTAYDRFHGNGPYPDQERTNQNARIYLKTTLPYNNVEYSTAFLYSDWLHFRWHVCDEAILVNSASEGYFVTEE